MGEDDILEFSPSNKNNNSRTTSVEDIEAGLHYLKRLNVYYEAKS
jgi:hypothetical protein